MKAAIHAVGLGSIAVVVLFVGGCMAVFADVHRRGEWVRAGNDPAAYVRGSTARQCELTERPVRVELDRSEYPGIVRDIRESWRRGFPRVLRVHREGADQRRDRATATLPPRRGFDRDEAPAASLRWSWRAYVAYVPSRENRSAGAVLGRAIRGWCDGQRVVYRFTE